MAVRFARQEDSQALLAIYSYYVEETAISFEHQVPSLEEFQGRMEKIQAFYPYLVWEEEGDILGYAYAGPFRQAAAYAWAVESTIYLAPKARGRGLGHELYGELEPYLEQMGIRSINACIGIGPEGDPYISDASKNFHRQRGFQEVAHFREIGSKFNRWYDMIWMEKKIGKPQERMKAPRSIGEVLEENARH